LNAFMKKQILLTSVLLAGIAALVAQPAAWSDCLSGAVVTRTWTNAAADNDWHNAANWSPGAVPDCNDNVVFVNSSSSAVCYINADVTVRDIDMGASGSGYKSGIILRGNAKLSARNLTMFGGIIQGSSTSQMGQVRVNTIATAENAYVGLKDFSASGNVVVGAGAIVTFGSLAMVEIGGTLTINAYGSFGAAGNNSFNSNKGITTIWGDLVKHKISSFAHREGLVSFVNNGTTATASSLDLSPGSGQGFGGKISFYNLVINQAPYAVNVNRDEFGFNSGSGGADTAVVWNNMSVLQGDMNGGSGGIFQIRKKLALLGAGDELKLANFFHFAGNQNIEVVCEVDYTAMALNNNNNSRAFVQMWGGGDVHVNAGNNSEIHSRFLWTVESGQLAFDDDVFQWNRLYVNGGSLTLPAGDFNMKGERFWIYAGLNHNNGHFYFSRTDGNTTIDFDAQKDFYDLTINMPGATASTPRTLTSTDNNDLIGVDGDFNYVEGAWRGSGVPTIDVKGNITFGAALTDNDVSGAYTTNGFRMVGADNAILYANGVPQGTGTNWNFAVEKDNAANKVIVTTTASSTILMDGGSLNIAKGILEFDGATHVSIFVSDVAAANLIIGAAGKLIAPASKNLSIAGSWTIINSKGFDANGGTVKLIGGSAVNFFQNNRAVKLNNLVVERTSTSSGAFASTWGGNRGSASETTDTLAIEGDLVIFNSNATLVNVYVVLKGNYTSVSNQSGFQLDGIDFVGSAVQNVEQRRPDEFEKTVVKVNGAGVKLVNNNWVIGNSAPVLGVLELIAGNINANGYTVLVTGNSSNDRLIGGGAASYVFGGPLTIANGTSAAWTAGMVYPVGSATNYRPVLLQRTTASTGTVRYYESSYGNNAVTSPLDAVNADNAWWAITTNTNITVALTTDQAPAYNEIVVARFNSSSSEWESRGGNTSSYSGFVASTSISTSGTYHYSLGQVPVVPVPISVIQPVAISGQELATQRASNGGSANAAVAGAVAFGVYPNPAAETLNFRVVNADKGVITLSDMNGKVYGTYNAAEVNSVNISNLSAGVYMVTFTDGLNKITHRVVKN